MGTKINFEVVKQIAREAVASEAFVAANSILQTQATLDEVLDRIDFWPVDFMISRFLTDLYSFQGGVTEAWDTRTVDVGAGDPAPDINEAIFDVYSPGIPFRLHGWAPTIIDDGGGVDLADLEIFFRDVTDPATLEADAPWQKLLPEDCTEAMNNVQIRLVAGTLTTGLSIRRIAIFACQA